MSFSSTTSASDPRPLRPWMLLHLLWAVPLVVVVDFFPLLGASIAICGFDACRVSRGDHPGTGVFLLVLATVVAGTIFSFVPWYRRLGWRVFWSSLAAVVFVGILFWTEMSSMNAP